MDPFVASVTGSSQIPSHTDDTDDKRRLIIDHTLKT